MKDDLIGTAKAKLKRIRGSKVNSCRIDSRREAEKQNWALFAENMILEEDVRALKNDLRYRSVGTVEREDTVIECSEAAQIWNFGKQIGLRGNESVMIRNLKKLDGQVSNLNLIGMESADDGF